MCSCDKVWFGFHLNTTKMTDIDWFHLNTIKHHQESDKPKLGWRCYYRFPKTIFQLRHQICNQMLAKFQVIKKMAMSLIKIRRETEKQIPGPVKRNKSFEGIFHANYFTWFFFNLQWNDGRANYLLGIWRETLFFNEST